MPRKNEPRDGTDYSKLSSDELIRICADGAAPEAWDAFIHRFHKRITAVVYRVARRYPPEYLTLREDMVQAVYLRLCKNECKVLRDYTLRHENGAMGYLGVIATSTVHDFFRSKGNLPTGGEELPEDGPAIDHGEDRKDLQRDVDKILRAKATPRDQEIFRLYYIQGLTAKMISQKARFGLSESGVETLVRKLGRLVRDELNRPGGKDNPKRFGKGKALKSSFIWKTVD
ncbi:MAG: sigma-70 family RNA polymerase sigma factor [Bryobacteraceae bacterium]